MIEEPTKQLDLSRSSNRRWLPGDTCVVQCYTTMWSGPSDTLGNNNGAIRVNTGTLCLVVAIHGPSLLVLAQGARVGWIDDIDDYQGNEGRLRKL